VAPKYDEDDDDDEKVSDEDFKVNKLLALGKVISLELIIKSLPLFIILLVTIASFPFTFFFTCNKNDGRLQNNLFKVPHYWYLYANFIRM